MSWTTTSHWCHTCCRLVSLEEGEGEGITGLLCCSLCGGGFVEEMDAESAASMLLLSQSSQNHHTGGARIRQWLRGRLRGRSGRAGRAHLAAFVLDSSSSPSSSAGARVGPALEGLIRHIVGRGGAGDAGSTPASKSAIEAMPTFAITEESLFSSSQCAICKEAFALEEEAREMPCKHIYHTPCILPWLETHNSCPLCRAEMPAEPEEEEETDNGSERGIAILIIPDVGLHVFSFAMRPESPEEGPRPGIFLFRLSSEHSHRQSLSRAFPSLPSVWPFRTTNTTQTHTNPRPPSSRMRRLRHWWSSLM